MSDQQSDNLPSEVQELPEGAQNIFQAAFKSSQEDGLDEAAALQVAWNTVKSEYECGDDGSWRRKSEGTAIHGKAVTSGGN